MDWQGCTVNAPRGNGGSVDITFLCASFERNRPRQSCACRIRAFGTARRTAWDDPDWPMFDMGGYGCGARFLYRMAIEKNNLALARWLRDHGANPDAPPAPHPKWPKRSLYEDAVAAGRPAIAAVLRQHGGAAPRLDAVTDDELYLAACLLLDRETAIAPLHRHPEFASSPKALFEAARIDNVAAVALILDLGTPVNARGDDGETALHLAAASNATGVLSVLLARGADPDVREGRWDATPLGFAVHHGREAAIELLVLVSTDVWNLTYLGRVDRVREVLATAPRLASETTIRGVTPLFWLPADDERASGGAGRSTARTRRRSDPALGRWPHRRGDGARARPRSRGREACGRVHTAIVRTRVLRSRQARPPITCGAPPPSAAPVRYYLSFPVLIHQGATVTATDLIDRLAAHKTVGAAPREELAWLVAHGSLRHLNEGEVVSTKDVPVAGLFVVLTGHIAIFVDRGAGRHKAIEWRGGDVAGALPYSRLVSPPADSVAQEPSEILFVRREDFAAMIRECHEITSILVHKMVDRARVFTSSGLHDEKMISLGKLSAGLAHELNNPASAIERSAALLESHLDEAERAARALGASSLTDRQLEAIDRLRASCLAAPAPGVWSPIQQAEREDAIGDWLTEHGLDAAIAGPLAETAVTLDALDGIAETIGGPPLDAVLRWTAAGCSVRGLASEIQDAATRISGLVMAIKGFTYMDQAPVAEPVDLTQSLGNTVAVLKSKALKKSVAVAVSVEPDLPRVRGFGGELNQIWANLIDNALDAVADSGRVEVTATRERQRV